VNFSVTDMKNWKECPLRAKRLMELTREEYAGPRRVGQAGHAVAAEYVEHLMRTQQATDVVEGRAIADRIATHLSPEDERDLRSFIFASVEAIDVLHLHSAQQWQVEKRLHFCLYCRTQLVATEVAEHGVARGHDVFSFTPDLWWVDANGMVHVWDWKTGHVIQHVDHPDEQFQLDMYLGALCQITGLPGGFVHLFHMRHNEHEQSGWVSHEEPPTPKMGMAERFLVQAQEAAKGFRVTEERAVLGAQCATCDVNLRCEKYLARVGDYGAHRQENLDYAIDVTDAAIFGDLSYAAKSRLKERMVVSGLASIQDSGGTHEAILNPVERNSVWDPACFEELKKFLPETDLLFVYQPTNTRLEKVLKKHKMVDMLPALEAKYRHRTMSTDLKIRRIGARHQKESASTDPSTSSNSGGSSNG